MLPLAGNEEYFAMYNSSVIDTTLADLLLCFGDSTATDTTSIPTARISAADIAVLRHLRVDWQAHAETLAQYSSELLAMQAWDTPLATLTRGDYEVSTLANIVMLLYLEDFTDENALVAHLRAIALRAAVSRCISPRTVDDFFHFLCRLTDNALAQGDDGLLLRVQVAAQMLGTVQRETFAFRASSFTAVCE